MLVISLLPVRVIATPLRLLRRTAVQEEMNAGGTAWHQHCAHTLFQFCPDAHIQHRSHLIIHERAPWWPGALALWMKLGLLPRGSIAAMPEQAPADLHADIIAEVDGILEKVRQAGWYVGPFHWKDENARTVKICVRSPSGTLNIILCEEGELPTQMQTLLRQK